jgi:hypothetical protein
MSLAAIMLEQLAVARLIVEDEAEVIPAWRITTPEGSFLVLTRFDHNKEGQRERALFLISKFMAWKLATSFVVTAETWLGPGLRCSGPGALLVVGVSYHERLAAMQRLRRADVVTFAEVEWLTHDQVDETYFKILPTGRSEITAEEAHELAVHPSPRLWLRRRPAVRPQQSAQASRFREAADGHLLHRARWGVAS